MRLLPEERPDGYTWPLPTKPLLRGWTVGRRPRQCRCDLINNVRAVIWSYDELRNDHGELSNIQKCCFVEQTFRARMHFHDCLHFSSRCIKNPVKARIGHENILIKISKTFSVKFEPWTFENSIPLDLGAQQQPLSQIQISHSNPEGLKLIRIWDPNDTYRCYSVEKRL